MTKEIVLSVKKQKLKYRVETTNNKYTFSEDTIIKYSIFKGREFTEAEFEEILATEEVNSLLNKAINYLSYQARSESEVKNYLIDKGATDVLAIQIITKIQELGYLNDEMLANSLLDYVIRSLKGPRVLEEKLTKKNISEELIRNTLHKYTEEIEENVIEDLLNKILARYRTYPVKKQKTLIYQKLLRDGFNNEAVNAKLNRLEFIDESDEKLEKEVKKLLNKYQDNFDYNLRSKIISKLMAKGYEYSKIIESLNSIE